MKKLLLLILILSALVFAASCGDDPISTESGGTNTDTDTTVDSNVTTDSDSDTDLNTDTDERNDGENQNDILGPGWTPPQN